MLDQSFLFNNSKEIAEQYSALEHEILELLNKFQSSFSSKLEINKWVKLALNDKKKFKKVVSTVLKKYDKQLKDTILKNIEKTIDETVRLADANVGAIKKLSKNWEPPKIASDRVKFLDNLSPQVKESLEIMNKEIKFMNSNILNRIEPWYTRSIQNTASEIQSGVKTYKEAIANTLTKWADKGVPSIISKNGRVINPRTYAETVTRATMKKDYVKNTTKRYKEYGLDLVSSQVLGDSSQICEDDQGVIFSESGSNPKYRALSGASDGFLTHINCRHTLTPYVEGVSEKPTKITEEEIAKARKLRLQSRYNERMIRKYKMRNIGLSNQKNKSLVRKWQAKQRELYSRNPQMRRDYFREKIFEIHTNNAMNINTPIKPVNTTKPKVVKKVVKPKPVVKKTLTSSDFKVKDKSNISKAFDKSIVQAIKEQKGDSKAIIEAFGDYTKGRLKWNTLNLRDGQLFNNVLKKTGMDFKKFNTFSENFYKENFGTDWAGRGDIFKKLKNEKWMKDITQEEENLIMEFFGKQSREFNPNHFFEVSKKAKLVDETTETVKLKENIKLFRINHGVKFELESLDVGDEFIMNQQTSTSWNGNWFDEVNDGDKLFSIGDIEEQPVLWEIEAPKGTKAVEIRDVALEAFKIQDEVLISSGQKFKVIGKRYKEMKLWDDHLGKNVLTKVLVQIVRIVV